MFWKVTAVFAVAAVVMYYLREKEFHPGRSVTLAAYLSSLFDGQFGITCMFVDLKPFSAVDCS